MTSPIETKADLGAEPDASWSFWSEQLKLAEKEHEEWAKRAREVVKRYRDDRATALAADGEEGKRFNILWSNTEVLKPAIYFRPPVPAVERRFKDNADAVSRTAATLIERCLAYCTDAPGYDFNAVMEQCRDDMLLPGRGVAWVRYAPSFGPETTGSDGKPYRPVASEEIITDYVFWEDFRHGPARVWAEVPWVARRAYLTRGKLKERFGAELGQKVTLDYTPPQVKDEDAAKAVNDGFKKAVVWEIWDRDSGKVVWFAASYKEGLLDEKDPPLKLAGFFPCPRPLTAVTTNGKLHPIPEYCLYQDQAKEIDDLTFRISRLVKAIKVVGIHDASAVGLERALNEGVENTTIPVENWASLMGQSQGKGLDGVMSFVPIEQAIKALIALYDSREKAKSELYEITGIADIIRGAGTGPVKTATEQRIKGQFATLRLQDRQGEVQRFARDLFRIKSEIIAENFSPQTLKAMTGLALPMAAQKEEAKLAAQAAEAQQQPIPEQVKAVLAQPSWEEVTAFLRDDGLRSYQIDVETDSTIAVDEQADKEAATEFLAAITTFMQNAMPIVQAMPELLGLASETLMFVVRRFRAGRSLEAAFEQAMEQLKEAAAQPKPQPADPKMAEAQARAQLAKEKQDADIAGAQTKAQADAEQKRLSLENERAKIDADLVLHRQAAEHKHAERIEDLAVKERVDKYAAELEHSRQQKRLDDEIGFKRAEAAASRAIEADNFDASQALDREKAKSKAEATAKPKLAHITIKRSGGKIVSGTRHFADGTVENIDVADMATA